MKTKGLRILSIVLLCAILAIAMTGMTISYTSDAPDTSDVSDTSDAPDTSTTSNISYTSELHLWHSDSNSVGTWKGTQIKYAHKKLNTHSNFYFYAGGLYAMKQWEDALDITIENVVSMSEANIKVFGGTWNELITLGFEYENKDVLGYVNSIKSKTIRIETMNERRAYVAQIEEAVIVIIDKGFMSNYNYVTTHELGHAMGWLGGHSGDKNDVMYAIRNGVSTLTTRDKEHLLQVY